MISHNNIFTVDIEDGIYTNNINTSLSGLMIDKIKENIIQNTKSILKILRQSDSTATFFVLGKLTEDIPELIMEIHQEGHEIASHGYEHKRLIEMNPDSFSCDLERTSNAIFNACGVKPTGYRAPYFSISNDTLWAINILKEMEYDYDSSIQPFGYHPQYGSSGYTTKIFNYENGLIEIPMSVTNFRKIRIPCSGGSYFRFYPFNIFTFLFRKSNIQNNYSIFYIHQWELNNYQTFDTKNIIARFRKYYNSEKSISKLEKLTSEFNFVSIRRYLNKMNIV